MAQPPGIAVSRPLPHRAQEFQRCAVLGLVPEGQHRALYILAARHVAEEVARVRKGPASLQGGCAQLVRVAAGVKSFQQGYVLGVQQAVVVDVRLEGRFGRCGERVFEQGGQQVPVLRVPLIVGVEVPEHQQPGAHVHPVHRQGVVDRRRGAGRRQQQVKQMSQLQVFQHRFVLIAQDCKPLPTGAG